MSLRERLEHKRLKEGLTLRVLAKMLKINYTLLSDWLRGTRDLSTNHVSRVVWFLEMDSDTIQAIRKRLQPSKHKK